MQKFVTYFRVSTKQQGASGLGLEAQEAAVKRYVAEVGGEIIAPAFTEIESGKVKDRPELKKAIAHARRHKAKLLVAKLDRLSRNLAFVATLMDSKVDFIACDNPHANTLTIHILAAVGQEEARAISARTKAALEAAKARGTLLGSSRPGHWEGREDRRAAGQKKATEKAAKVKKEKRLADVADLLPALKELKEEGRSLRAIATEMESRGTTSPTGAPWNPMMVMRLLK
jgi:DNA invertase Pin-like site-specific DNA recombinase